MTYYQITKQKTLIIPKRFLNAAVSLFPAASSATYIEILEINYLHIAVILQNPYLKKKNYSTIHDKIQIL